MKKSIEFDLEPDGCEIEKAAKKGGNFLKFHGLSDDSIQKQLMVLNELIASGKKLNNLKMSKSGITVHLYIDGDTITAEVKKPVGESKNDRQLQELDKTIQMIRGFQDPFEPYLIKLQEAIDNSSSNEANGLGLARIAYETGAILDFYVSEENILNLCAVRHLNGCHSVER